MITIKQNSVFLAFLFILMAGIMSCKENVPMDLAQESIIPKPVSIMATNSSFKLEEGLSIYVKGEAEELNQIGQYLAKTLKPSTGFEIEVQSTDKEPGAGNIYLTISDSETELGEEGYELIVTENLISLNADKPAGLIRGIQTLRQILPPKIESTTVEQGPWLIATGTITDYPDYSYRGAMLDVSRHFFGVDDVKRYIDLLTYYKINVLHLHLSDDQGWRIEIKSWPNLTTHGGSTQVGGGEGGYYTQEQYKDIVKYAQERYIIIIPEIDMPGHTNAALASYPELNCDGKATELYTGTEVGFSTLCIKKELTYKFVDDVIRELAAITPGPYIHIGGDESHVTPMEDYIPFINRVQDIVLSHNKIMIGWDEVAHASLKQNSVVQFWAKTENAIKGVNQSAKVIMSPAVKTYLDMQYDSTTTFGLHWAAYIEVDSAYIWDPATFVEGITKENILGIEAPLWTETITKMDEIEYMVFPRLPGHAEVGWSAPDARDWDEYKIRLGKHAERFDALGINYYKSKLVPWVNDQE
ncbi:MAG: beta-N-acetylhexosaminidase [Bacteroidetes bacterium]|nr:MAG: beta-N-acetylhexosaminidase [Bacteroidota bacterium]